jgi:hypothetical protein
MMRHELYFSGQVQQSVLQPLQDAFQWVGTIWSQPMASHNLTVQVDSTMSRLPPTSRHRSPHSRHFWEASSRRFLKPRRTLQAGLLKLGDTAQQVAVMQTELTV